jgi:hypothetical protein
MRDIRSMVGNLIAEAVVRCRAEPGDLYAASSMASMNNLAAVSQDLGDLSTARQLHERVLAARQRVLGDEHPSTLGLRYTCRIPPVYPRAGGAAGRVLRRDWPGGLIRQYSQVT